LKKAIVSVTNNLLTDQRVDRTCNTLTKLGYEVLLIGRKLETGKIINDRKYKLKRMCLLFNKGPLFYAEYNFRLFFLLLFKKAALLVSNDLDTLLPNFLIHKIKNVPIVYDSHEYFCGVPELQVRWAKKVWQRIEKWIFPKLKNIITVNDSIAKLYHEEYGKDLTVVRNIPVKRKFKNLRSRKELGLPADKKIILLQGAGINIDRGAEEAVQAMQYVDNALFLIIGGGDVIEILKKMTVDLKIENKVKFIPKQAFEKLYNYTIYADIGLTLDKDTNINYRYSLPNKLFDYIHAGVPVLASDLVEIKRIIEKYEIGDLIDNHKPENIAGKLNQILANKDTLKTWKKNLKRAANELSWEKEEKKLIGVFEGEL